MIEPSPVGPKLEKPRPDMPRCKKCQTLHWKFHKCPDLAASQPATLYRTKGPTVLRAARQDNLKDWGADKLRTLNHGGNNVFNQQRAALSPGRILLAEGKEHALPQLPKPKAQLTYPKQEAS